MVTNSRSPNTVEISTGSTPAAGTSVNATPFERSAGGGEGAVVLHNGRTMEIPAARPAEVFDPTGCGDAYRAGLLFGLLAGADWEITGRVASLMGAIKVGSPGTQNHSASRQSLGKAYEENFGQDPGLW